MPDDSEFLCRGWVWDPVLRELRYFERGRKGWKDEPEQTERLPPVRSVTWHRWSQAPMQTATGAVMPASLSRIIIAYETGGDLTVNENDRECAGKLARAVAETYGLAVAEEGAPGGKQRGNLPSRDDMGRLVTAKGKEQLIVDDTLREIVHARPRFPFGTRRRRVAFTEVRRLELGYEVKGPQETFTLWALVGPDQERVPTASYGGYEGWADPEEWREFAREVASSIGVEVTGA